MTSGDIGLKRGSGVGSSSVSFTGASRVGRVVRSQIWQPKQSCIPKPNTNALPLGRGQTPRLNVCSYNAARSEGSDPLPPNSDSLAAPLRSRVWEEEQGA